MRIRMDWRAVKSDWNRARAFLVTAEEGSLSAAARALGMAQPTEPSVRRALPGLAPMTFPIWLTTHRELNTSRRVRLVFDMLAGMLSQPPVSP
jgi:DNA-binding transcriptional LysR family regulator